MRSIVVEGAPTKELSAAVDALAGLDPTLLCVAELQAVLAVLAPALGRLAGIQSAVVGELQARSGGTVPSAPGPDGTAGPAVAVRHWLRDLTTTGGSAAGRAVHVATLLRSLPLLSAAVRDGRVQPAQAAVLTRLVGPIDPQALADAEPALVLVAAQRDPQSLAVYVSHLLATWCEPQFEADSRSQQARRYLQTSREAGGMLTGRFRLTAADSETFLTLLEPLARPSGLAETRHAGQRRADALIEVFELGLRFADLPQAGGHRPQLSYVLPAGWAAGQPPAGTFVDLVAASLPDGACRCGTARPADRAQDDGADATGCRCGANRARSAAPVEDLCATGVWSGPQTRARIETLLCDARLTRVLLTDLGQVRSLVALGDTVTATQRRALVARDHGCATRGCTRPPAFCDAHHLEHLADGGATHLHNLVLLCRRHHTRWHQGRLQLRDLHVPWLTTIDARHDPP